MATSILIVEDEYDISEAIRSVLCAEGYEVDCCSDGRSAIQYLEKRVPKLVITDVMMPYVSGLEVVKWIRHSGAHSQVPVILMSAVPPSAKQNEFGWNRFIKKPMDIDILLDAVSCAISPGGA
jgi:DNA-binding response OmpR family regulator